MKAAVTKRTASTRKISPKNSAEPKSQTRAFWGLLAFGAVWIFTVGVCKLFGVQAFVDRMADLHFSPAFTRFIGLWEVSAAVALYFPRIRPGALIGLMILMNAAFACHLAAGEPVTSGLGAIFAFGLFGYLLYLNSPKKLIAVFKVK